MAVESVPHFCQLATGQPPPLSAWRVKSGTKIIASAFICTIQPYFTSNSNILHLEKRFNQTGVKEKEE